MDAYKADGDLLRSWIATGTPVQWAIPKDGTRHHAVEFDNGVIKLNNAPAFHIFRCGPESKRDAIIWAPNNRITVQSYMTLCGFGSEYPVSILVWIIDASVYSDITDQTSRRQALLTVIRCAASYTIGGEIDRNGSCICGDRYNLLHAIVSANTSNRPGLAERIMASHRLFKLGNHQDRRRAFMGKQRQNRKALVRAMEDLGI